MMAGMQLHQIAERTLNRPLLLHPDKASVILNVLEGRMPGLDPGSTPTPDESAFFGTRRRVNGSSLVRAEDGVAVVSIVGSLVNRGAWIGASSGLVSYEGINAQLTDAANDPEISSIILDLDSPGGEALGMTTLAAKVRAVNKVKPVVAVVNDMAASAAYGIASGASRIIVSETSITGSIGVVMMHADFSTKMAKDGIDVTMIHAGAHKVDGNPFEPLTNAVRSDLQDEVMKHYGLFIDTVHSGRGKRTSKADAKATEARVYIGADAIKAGLADGLGNFESVVADLKSKKSGKGQTSNTGAQRMPVQQYSNEMLTSSTDPAESAQTQVPGKKTAQIDRNAIYADRKSGANYSNATRRADTSSNAIGGIDADEIFANRKNSKSDDADQAVQSEPNNRTKQTLPDAQAVFAGRRRK